jgi:heptosyltransferase-2
VLSFDDEDPVCALASRLAEHGAELSGAYLDERGVVRYTRDAAPWFDMGLLSVHGKEEADRRKRANRESHPRMFARMLGIEPGEPELVLPEEALAAAAAFASARGLHARGPAIGLNTGAGGRWESKRLPVPRVVELAREIDRRRGGRVSFLLLGGRDEAQRNAEIRAGLGGVRLIDAGTELDLSTFAALVDRLDLLVTSDSLALHVAVARRVPVVAFFAPTSAAEIELYGRGEKVESSAPDSCSYRSDADTSTLTAGRLADAVERVLAGGRARPYRAPDRA